MTVKKSKYIYYCFVASLALLTANIGAVAAAEAPDVTINGRSLSVQEIQRLETQLGVRVKPGDYFMNVSRPSQSKGQSSLDQSAKPPYQRALASHEVASR